MLIINKRQLGATRQRKWLLTMAEAGMQRVLAGQVMRTTLTFDADNKTLIINQRNVSVQGRIFVMGGGKASGLMAQELEKIIPSQYITAGVVNCVSDKYKTKKIKIIEAGHPTPNAQGVKGVKQMLKLKEKYDINQDDLVICLISGGGSALMPCPQNGLTLQDKQKTTRLLVESGPTIQEINIVRKHLSKIKGGQLGKYFSPAKVVALIISDVVGNDLSSIASGPTYPDKSTFKQAYQILKKYNLLASVPSNVQRLIRQGCQAKVPETPDKLTNCHNYIIADNQLALAAVARKAKKLKLRPQIVTSKQTGDPARVARQIAYNIIHNQYAGNAIILGGETTPRLPQDHGQGGRNQHYVAVSLLAMQKYPGKWTMASLATDGADYLAGIGGAMIDNDSWDYVLNKKLDIQSYLKRYDSYNLLKKINNSLIKMNNTGTNVCDIVVYLLH